MKEVLTKSFWIGVKKTYEEALKEPEPQPKAIEEQPVEETEKSGAD